MTVRGRSGAAQVPAAGAAMAAVPPMPRRRLPVLLLLVLCLVLGATLAMIAVATSRPAGPDAGIGTALAQAVAAGRAAVVDRADQAPLVRMLGSGNPSGTTIARARGLMDDLAADLGDRGAGVLLIDPAGRTRLARDLAGGSRAEAIPGLERALDAVLAARGTGYAGVVGPGGRSLLLAASVPGADGGSAGVLVATVPLSALLATVSDRPMPASTISVGSAGGVAWVSLAGPVAPGPFPANGLLALAVLSLLALPLAWWAARRPRSVRPASLAATAAAIPVAARHAPPVPRAPAPAPPLTTPTTPAVPPLAADTATPSTGRRRWGRGRGAAQDAAVSPVPADVAAPLAEAPVGHAGSAALPEDLLDPLSGLGNHRAYQEELDRLFVAYERTHVPFALLLLDIDDLKITNTRAGRAAGDEQIRTLGRQIRGMLRYSDRAFRVGGDEVALLLPHTEASGGVQLGQRLLAKVRAGAEGEPAVAFSGGVSAFPATAGDRDELMQGAQAALSWAKQHGRGNVQLYEPGRHGMESDAERAARDAMVDQVIRERTLRAVFQPIVDMATGDVVGFEGLTRPSPGAPFANPGALFEAAEGAGRTVELDAACFATIAEGARAIPPDRVVSINLSPRTMEASDFSVEGVLATLAAHELDPGRVILELTERETVMDLDRLRDNLSALQRAGVRIAADDVGAGNAGLRLLSQFRFDIVKVDLSLVQEGANNDASRAVLRSLRDLALRWGAFVIAEGIETSTQLKVVRELGLAAGQGYLIGRPGTYVDLPPVDLAGLEQGGLMLQNAPVPTATPHPA